ncbi:MAG TPA: response regulator [Dissulfurispiraceae bacterium]|nr:response regulator [Dissulfurispiraceae bacterium]
MSDEVQAQVLLVDDEEKFLDLLSQRLTMHGVQADTATSGEDALEKIRHVNYDAVVLDLVMPGIGGIETVKRLRSENPDMQIIMLSGQATIEKTVQALKEGAMDFIEKPADVDTLLAKIGEAKHKNMLLALKNVEEKVKGGLRRRL